MITVIFVYYITIVYNIKILILIKEGYYMHKVLDLLKEQVSNLNLIWKLTIYNMHSQYANHYLGVFWNILQPAMQVILYYIVFGLGLRGIRGDVNDIPFIIHLISGLFPWMFLSSAVNSGAMSIYSKLGLVTKMKFPSSILISISITGGMINLFITTLILFLLSLFYNFVPFINYFGFIYFLIASFTLTFSISLLMSTLVVLIRDTRNILQNVMRMMFFLTPIFWSIESATPLLQKISLFNPFAYLVGVYRNTFVHGGNIFYGDIIQVFYFWSLTLLILLIGTYVHYRFRHDLVDYK